MSNPLDIYGSTAREIDGVAYQLPFGLSVAFSAIYKAHTWWRWKRHLQEITKDPASFTQYGFGMAFNAALNSEFCRYFGGGFVKIPLEFAARILLISKCCSECIQEYKQLCFSAEQIKTAFYSLNFARVKCGHFDPKNRLHVILSYLFDPGTIGLVHLRLKLLAMKITTLCYYSFFSVVQLFTLSMCSIQLMEAFIFSSQTKSEAMNKLWLHWGRILKEIADNKEALVQRVEENKVMIDRLISWSKLPIRSDDFVEAAKKATASAIATNKLYNETTMRLVDGAREVAASISFGLLNTVPKWLKAAPETIKKTVKLVPAKAPSGFPIIFTHKQGNYTSIKQIQDRAIVSLNS